MNSKIKILSTFVTKRWLQKFRNRNKLEKYQEKMIKKQIKFLKKKSLFYKSNFPDADKLSDFPIIDKNIMMNNFNTMNTVGITKEEALSVAIEGEKSRNFNEKCSNITVGLSSGTSGHRGVFIVGDNEQSVWAGTVLAKLLPENEILNNKIAFFLRANSNLYESVKSKALDFRYFDILQPMEENIKKLREYNPTILVAPPSVLLQIAEVMEKSRLDINPSKIISVAEVLEEKDLEYIKRIFKKEIIHQVYQCTEGFLACTCKYGRLHINEDMIKLEKEWLDETRFIPIITDFKRSSQPIIRYRLNDILVTKNRKCECGSPMLVVEKIEGRDDDVFIFESQNGENVKVFSDFIRRCILFTDEIREYRVVQVSKDYVKIYMVGNEEKRQDIIKEFENLAMQMQFKMPKIEFLDYTVDRNKKLKRVERMF